MQRRHDSFYKLERKYEETSLRNWEKWQKEWKKTQDTITEKLSTQPGDLVMNYHEDLIQINKEKEVFEYARIPTKFDKYRGNPDFYKLPCALSQVKCSCIIEKCLCYCGTVHKKVKYSCSLQEPKYFAVKTKQERFIVPPITMTGSPSHIQKEKNILHGSRNIYKRWQSNSYRQQQMQKWSQQIQNIVPHFPNFENLAIVGTTILPPELAEEPVHNEAVTEEINETHSENLEIPHELPPKLSLKLNDIILEQTEETEGNTKMRLFFEYDISSKKVSSNFLALENNSTVTLRLKWKKIEKFRVFRDYTKHDDDKYCFYFNKTELVILPGQKTVLPFWFKSDEPGHFSECWELITVPKMSGEQCHLFLLLESYSYFKDLKASVNAILSHIETESKNLLIKEIVLELVDQVKYVETPAPICVYGEPQLFELANFVNERPQFLYNQVFVDELLSLYNKVKVDDKKWDYCIKHLRKLAHKKDTVLYGENKLLELKEKLRRIQSGKPEKDPIGDPKSKKNKKNSKKSSKAEVTPSVKETIPKEPYEYSNQCELMNILRKFDSPVIHNFEREKYFACFEIFGAYIHKMCKQLEVLDTQYNIVMEFIIPPPRFELTPISKQPDRLIYEFFDHHYIPIERFDSFYPFIAKRKPKILQDILETDVETIYKKYFNKSLPSDKKSGRKKEKSKSPKEKSKSPKEKSKSPKERPKKVKEKGVKKEVSVESFDPYSETFVYSRPEQKVTPETAKATAASKQLSKDYKYKQYLLVYSCLCSAVDAVVDTLHSFECVASYAVIDVVQSHLPTSEK